MVPATRVQKSINDEYQPWGLRRESRPCENRPCASDGNVVLNIPAQAKSGTGKNEWARLALHGACKVQMQATAVRVTMWTGGKGETACVTSDKRRGVKKATRDVARRSAGSRTTRCRGGEEGRGKRRVGNIA